MNTNTVKSTLKYVPGVMHIDRPYDIIIIITVCCHGCLFKRVAEKMFVKHRAALTDCGMHFLN